jgi:hypothetical protein
MTYHDRFTLTTAVQLPRSFDWMTPETLGQAFARLRSEGLGDIHARRVLEDSDGPRSFHNAISEGLRKLNAGQTVTIGEAVALYWLARGNELDALDRASTRLWLDSHDAGDDAGMDEADRLERSARAKRGALTRATGGITWKHLES